MKKFLVVFLLVFSFATLSAGIFGWGTNNLQWSDKTLNTMKWGEAENYCKKLDEGGHNDWRLPTIDELKTLIKNPDTQTGGSSKFGDTGKFWSSSTMSDNPYIAWYVFFRTGTVSYSSKVETYYVRCVR